MNFNHRKIEKKWQIFWKENNTYSTNLNSKKKKFYILDMYPYPSGAGLHVGHPLGYTATDIIARMKKMQGFEVFHPMGWDAFGLPAEQYAINTGQNPQQFTNKNIAFFKKQLKSFGYSFDWNFEINTSDPQYYKWTQWIFAQIYKQQLAELKDIEVNWSPSLNTVLANEELLIDQNDNVVAERDGLPVEKRVMQQWVLKITKYAQRLFDGLDNLDWPESVKKLQKNWIYERDENGNYTKNLHLRDWVFARQRYWGEPFPVAYFENGEIYLIPETKYPVKLPKLKEYKFSKDGKPALSKADQWINIKVNGKNAQRDFNTMPQWAGSSWYYIAYLLRDKKGYLALNSQEAAQILNKWLPVDLYIGGQEHAVTHLLYARFWHLFLKDLGILKSSEPFQKLFNQGMILGENGVKMSKSKGNAINPDQIIIQYGADALRMYEMFMGALEDDKSWSYEQLAGSRNWLNRIYRLFVEEMEYLPEANLNESLKYDFNQLLQNVELAYSTLRFNLAISEMMIFINKLFKQKQISKIMAIKFLQLLSCICPHIAQELASKIDNIYNVQALALKKWPEIYNLEDFKIEFEIAVQINGKIRGRLKTLDLDITKMKEEQLLNLLIKITPKYINEQTVIKKLLVINKNLISVLI